jgi:hypothetical protein
MDGAMYANRKGNLDDALTSRYEINKAEKNGKGLNKYQERLLDSNKLEQIPQRKKSMIQRVMSIGSKKDSYKAL